jgi:uncharacterized SAM-dependent methyltransferase
VKYFKNTDLIRLLNVSDKTVRNWVQGAQTGKIELDLWEEKGRTYIADTLANAPILERLAEKGRKYRNSRTYKVLTPTRLFYDLYSTKEIIEIASSLDDYGKYPFYYRYTGEGAKQWSDYLDRLGRGGSSNILNETIDLLGSCYGHLDNIIRGYSHVNVVDVGIGNCVAAKDLLTHLNKGKKLRKYIAVDISRELLDAGRERIHQWFGDQIEYEPHQCNIGFDKLADISHNDTYDKDATSTLNIFLFLGGTVLNFKDAAQPLRILRESMSGGDLLISSLKLDTPRSRRFFDFDAGQSKAQLSVQNSFILDVLNISPNLYDVEQFYSENQKARIIQVRLRTSLELKFAADRFLKTVELKKGSTIEILRVCHYSDYEFLEHQRNTGLDNILSMKSLNDEYMISIAKLAKG